MGLLPLEDTLANRYKQLGKWYQTDHLFFPKGHHCQELFEVPIGLTQKKTPVEQIQERLSRATAHRPRALTADLRESRRAGKG